MHLDELQDVIARTYGERDAARGTAATVAWLCEELGELAQAVRKGSVDQQRHELGDVLADPSRIDAAKVVVVCQVGMRAQRAAAALRAAGVEASVLAGGIDAWNRDPAAVLA